MQITLFENKLLFSPEKITYLPVFRALLVSDLHLTKDNHFRKHGIPVPDGPTFYTLNKLTFVIEKYTPDVLYILGDMFHSDRNKGMEVFRLWRNKHTGVSLKLITGNHDILERQSYRELGIELTGEKILLGNILLTHEPVSGFQGLNICGHIHPGVTLSGKAKQNLRLPCFYFNGANLFLPSFGEFTGSKTIIPKKGDKIFAIADSKIIEVR